jgi:DNA transposition AAA+ family ATPase
MRPIDIILEHESILIPEQNSYSFSLRRSLLPHSRFKKAIKSIAELHHYSLENEVGGGVVITGPSGIGKTTILQHYLNLFPRVDEAEISRIPVLKMVTPSSPTVKSLAEGILLALGDPSAHRGSAEEKTMRIYHMLKVCGVELMLLDEFQHYFYAPSTIEFRRICDWLKNLISITGLAVVLCGLPEVEMVVNSSEQLDRRFSSKLALTPFRIDSEEDFAEFRGVLKVFQESLPLPVEVPLYEANLARRFLVASGGLLDYVRKILEGAVSIAISNGHQSLDLNVYAAGFRKEIWRDVGDRLNPFHPESPQRALDRVGEPFCGGDARSAIGSPLARRMSIKVQERVGI